jgi:hypothetical protein
LLPFTPASKLGSVIDAGRRARKGHVTMDYRNFTNDSLLMMYESIRGALASDDAQKLAMQEPRFRVRETIDWKEHAGSLEAEMLRRGMPFNLIDWSEDQGRLPL